MSLLILSRTDVDGITTTFTAEYLCDLMKDVFTLVSSKNKSDLEPQSYNPLRMSIPTEKHTTLIMPARITPTGTSIKIVSVPSLSDDKRGLPGSTLVLHKDTGAVEAILNARGLTALRTAAGSLLSTRLIGPTAPTRVVAFGAGKQIQAHLDLHLKAFPDSIQSCIILNQSVNSRVVDLVQGLQNDFPRVSFQYKTAGDAKEDVKNASIVICATPSLKPLFPSRWIRDGTHVILVGSYKPAMHEVDEDLIRRALRGTLLVDSRSACAEEAGELIDASVKAEDVTEIGEVAERHESVIETDSFEGPVTMFKSVGVGLQDVAVACAVVEQAKKMRARGEKVGVLIEDYDAV